MAAARSARIIAALALALAFSAVPALHARGADISLDVGLGVIGGGAAAGTDALTDGDIGPPGGRSASADAKADATLRSRESRLRGAVDLHAAVGVGNPDTAERTGAAAKVGTNVGVADPDD
jgi:hypothetical protein